MSVYSIFSHMYVWADDLHSDYERQNLITKKGDSSDL